MRLFDAEFEIPRLKINPKVIYGFLIFLLFIGVICSPMLFDFRRNQTETILKEASKGKGGLHTDAWGTVINVSIVISPERDIITATSAGKDKKFGTEDDLSHQRIDLNKSRLVGKGAAKVTKWGAKKGKEFIKGFAKEIIKREPKEEK